MEDLGYEKPQLVLLEAEKFVPTLSDYLKSQIIDDEDKNWLISVLGYFIGEILVQKYDGLWFLNEDLKSKTYGKYVVGGFSRASNSIAIDSFEISKSYVDNMGKDELKTVIDSLIFEVENM